MEEILSNYSVSDIFMVGVFLGYAICVLHDVLLSLTNYLNEKAWRVSDYEKIIYSYNKSSTFEFSQEDLDIEDKAIKNYEKRLQKRKNLNKFLNKFRKNK